MRGLVGDIAVAIFGKNGKKLGAVLGRKRKAARANGELSLAVRPA
jgi:hypothetical protein